MAAPEGTVPEGPAEVVSAAQFPRVRLGGEMRKGCALPIRTDVSIYRPDRPAPPRCDERVPATADRRLERSWPRSRAARARAASIFCVLGRCAERCHAGDAVAVAVDGASGLPPAGCAASPLRRRLSAAVQLRMLGECGVEERVRAGFDEIAALRQFVGVQSSWCRCFGDEAGDEARHLPASRPGGRAVPERRGSGARRRCRRRRRTRARRQGAGNRVSTSCRFASARRSSAVRAPKASERIAVSASPISESGCGREAPVDRAARHWRSSRTRPRAGRSNPRNPARQDRLVG